MELARRVKEKAQSHSEINLIPYTQIFPKDFEDMLRRVPSIDKLKGLTGLEPTRGIEQILDDVITYFRQN
jgi:UDP-glucose 4-epimerase